MVFKMEISITLSEALKQFSPKPHSTNYILEPLTNKLYTWIINLCTVKIYFLTKCVLIVFRYSAERFKVFGCVCPLYIAGDFGNPIARVNATFLCFSFYLLF